MWVDGYWKGPMKDGYPTDYYRENGTFQFPWERNLPPIIQNPPASPHPSYDNEKPTEALAERATEEM